MEYAFQSDGLRKRYGGTQALDALTMRVPEGSVYGFVGRNGAGKTTLIRILCGLTYPTGGTFSLCGVTHTDRRVESARRRIGAIVETPAVYMDMTAMENMLYQARALDRPSDAAALMRLVGLDPSGRKKVRHFSQGMRQKLGIAVALSGDPGFLILDEPTNGLDPQGIIDLRALITRLNRERGITFLISSHILDELARLATHYGFIDHGRMVREMTARELELACTKSTRVAVSSVPALARALDRRDVAYKIISDTQVDITGSVSLTRLAVELVGEDCEIYTCEKREESLETYFLRLVGGAEDA